MKFLGDKLPAGPELSIGLHVHQLLFLPGLPRVPVGVKFLVVRGRLVGGGEGGAEESLS